MVDIFQKQRKWENHKVKTVSRLREPGDTTGSFSICERESFHFTVPRCSPRKFKMRGILEQRVRENIFFFFLELACGSTERFLKQKYI